MGRWNEFLDMMRFSIDGGGDAWGGALGLGIRLRVATALGGWNGFAKEEWGSVRECVCESAGVVPQPVPTNLEELPSTLTSRVGVCTIFMRGTASALPVKACEVVPLHIRSVS